MRCSNCGNELEPGDAFCINCGEKVKKRDPEPPAPVRQEEVAPQRAKETPREEASYSGGDLYPPVGVFKFIGIFILMSIPIVNLFIIVKSAFGRNVNPSLRNFMRAMILFIIISGVLFVLSWTYIAPYIEDMLVWITG